MNKPQVPQVVIIEDVVGGLHPDDVIDHAKIQEAINVEMDAYEKKGQLTRTRADSWSQDYMVMRVIAMMKGGK